jgi:PadR family transcriptional regulator, regulatory protein PadR
MSEENLSPLKPAIFYILLALVDRDSHGYAVMQAVRERSGGRIPMRTGSFYRYLSQLLDAGLVAEAPAGRSSQDRDPRRGVSYRLTPAGRRALEQERTRLADQLRSLDVLRRPASRGSS